MTRRDGTGVRMTETDDDGDEVGQGLGEMDDGMKDDGDG